MPDDPDEDYVPNLGRPAWPGPVTLNSFLYPEPDRELDLFLVVIRGQSTHASVMQPHDQHWMFQYPLGRTRTGGILVYRRLHIVQEKNLMGVGDLDHLTNWGAITVPVGILTLTNGIYFGLKKLDKEKRRVFENIANWTKIMKPNGWWNCQDWCKTVLMQAVDKGILTKEEVKGVLLRAEAVQPMPYVG